MELIWFEFRGQPACYRRSGSGPLVLLVHGFAEDGDIWKAQRAFLEKDFRLLVPDLPGSGRSPLNPGMEAISDFADFLLALLDNEKADSCTLIGHSMGGYIGLAFAGKYPARLQAIGLFHSTAFADTPEKKATRQKSIAFIAKNGASAFIRQSTPQLFSEWTRKQNPGLITQLMDRYDNFQAPSLVFYYEIMISRPETLGVLASFRGPVLFIIGEKDQAVTLEHSLRQCHIPGLSYIHILENAGHMGMLEARDQVNAWLLEFLKNVTI